MAFRPADVIGLIWHHPILSLVVLLLFTPPLFPIVVYFSPLLISTALFVLAMVSMESDHADDPNPFSSDIPYSKRVWIEEVEIDGPLLDGERVPKRLKASSNDESWLDKVKNWEGTGRAWVESVLNQEARKSIDEIMSSKDESIPLLDKARGFFIEDVRQRIRDDELKSSKPSDGAQANDSAPSVPVESLADSVDDPPRPVAVDSGESSSNVIPDLESEDELIEIAPASIPPSPLCRKKLQPRADAPVNGVTELSKKAADGPSEAPSKTVESAGGSVLGTESEHEKKTASCSDSINENDRIPPIVEQKVVNNAPANVENSSSSGEIVTPRIVSVAKESNSVAKESNSVAKETAQGSSGEIMPEIKAASSGVLRINANDRNLTEKSQINVTTEGDRGNSGFQPKETKTAAESLGPLRPGRVPHGLETQSAAVALSEKLRVPLADIMSLLAGDCKENASNDGPSGVEVSSSSETTTSQEEEWSNSDVESSAPPVLPRRPVSVEKDP